jgi:hypothetical protein
MWIGNDATGSFKDTRDVKCGLEQMIVDNVMTNFEVICV